MKAQITTLWDGGPALPSEEVVLDVRWPQDPGEDFVFKLTAPWWGDPKPDGPVGPRPGLWDYEVVEVFVLGPDEQYTEIEVGPHGHHLVLRLHGRRNVVESALPLSVTIDRTETHWVADVRLRAELLPPRPWTWNAYAIHGVAQGRRYLALYGAPGPAPDFHRLDLFRPAQVAAIAP